MKITQLQNYIEKNQKEKTPFIYIGEYHEITEQNIFDLVEYIDKKYHEEELPTCDAFIEALQYNNSLWQYAESEKPIYNSELDGFIVGNGTAFDDYMSDFGYNPKMSYMQILSAIYTYTYEKDLYQAVESIYKEYTKSIEE